MFILNLIGFLILYVFGFPAMLFTLAVWILGRGWKDCGFFEGYQESWVLLPEVGFFLSVVGWFLIGIGLTIYLFFF